MNTGSSVRRGFTLVEVLASVVILAVGIVGVLQGLSVMTRAKARFAETEVMTRLAHEKVEELAATSTDITSNDSGDFTDRGDQKFGWSSSATVSSAANLYTLVVTITKHADPNKTVVVSTLVYVPAPTTTAGTN